MLCYSGISKQSAETGIPVFITFEGIEGSGKSLQIARAREYLTNGKGIECLVTREPGGTDFGLALRSVLLGLHGYRMEPRSELLLYLADRYQHLKEVIEPALERGLVILSDRYQDATRAYQGTARGIPGVEIEELNRLLGIIEPDKTILLDLDPEVGLSRARSRNLASASAAQEGRFEAEDLEFHKKVREAYLELAAQAPHRIHLVPASGTPDDVFARIFPLLDRWLASNK
ncbi:MAG: dTMP kinase [Acidobacteriota bacterium]